MHINKKNKSIHHCNCTWPHGAQPQRIRERLLRGQTPRRRRCGGLWAVGRHWQRRHICYGARLTTSSRSERTSALSPRVQSLSLSWTRSNARSEIRVQHPPHDHAWRRPTCTPRRGPPLLVTPGVVEELRWMPLENDEVVRTLALLSAVAAVSLTGLHAVALS